VNTPDAPAPSLHYLAGLTDDQGVVEHALYDRPRREYGYCTDDAGRLLGLASRLGEDPDSSRLAHACLGFLERAHIAGASFRLRQRGSGEWTSDPSSDDATGRALLGLGTAAAWAPWPQVRRRAQSLFDESCELRTPYPRALAYAALGAAEVARVEPAHRGGAALLGRASGLLDGDGSGARWPWPEPRLSYANALLPEAALAAAEQSHDAALAERALARLEWLVGRQVRGGHFSFVPVHGADEASTAPAFDQQAIEAYTMASACARAFAYTRDPRWAREVQRAAAWFLGDNDVGVAMFDPVTGGGYDGLEEHGVNLNQGAESSMAFVATMLALHDVRRSLGEDVARPLSANR